MAKLTKAQVVGYVQRRLPPSLGDARKVARMDNVESWISQACYRLSNMAWKQEMTEYRALQKAYSTLAITAGAVNLQTLAPDLLVEALPDARIVHSSYTLPLSWIPHETDALLLHQSDFGYYTVANDSIMVYDAAGAALTGTINISSAVFVPVLHASTAASTTLPEILNAPLIDMVLSFAREALGISAAAMRSDAAEGSGLGA